MTDQAKDMTLSVCIFAIAAIWTTIVISTIAPGLGDGDVGPRAFPLALGMILLALTAILFLKSWTAERDHDDEIVVNGTSVPLNQRIHWLPAMILLGETALYGFLLDRIGFLLATPVVLLIVMTVNFKIRSWRRLLGMALGLTIGCWLFFGKILGIYLASGSWISLG
jgi:putative tricarboxylic transport membrane protein